MNTNAVVTPLFLKTTTIMPVKEIYQTIAWYETVLGFQTVYIHGEGRPGEAEDYANYAIMVRDRVELHLMMEEGEGAGWTRAGNGHLGLTVSDVDSVYAAVKAAGIAIARELRQENWPARGFSLLDPSGNDIHIEQPAETEPAG